MNIIGLDALVFGVDDIQACADCLRDYGLAAIELSEEGGRFEALDGTAIIIRRHDDPALPPLWGRHLPFAKQSMGSGPRPTSTPLPRSLDVTGLWCVMPRVPCTVSTTWVSPWRFRLLAEVPSTLRLI